MLDPVANLVDRTLSGLDEPARVVAGNADQPGQQLAKGIWITNSGSETVTRITAEGDIVSTIDGVGARPTGIVIASHERVWVAAQDDDTLAIIRPVPEPIQGGPAGEPDLDTVFLKPEDCVGPHSLAVGFGSIWVTCADSGTVVRLDEESGAVQGSADVGESPEGIATDGQGVWVTSGGKDGTVTFLDPDKFPSG
jgi:DNA-binding beta-propeller fold protein YncE